MTAKQSWVLTDVARGTWVEECEFGHKELGLPDHSGVFVSKRALRGGLQDGVDVVEINNGALSVVVIPTRGMGIWRADYKGLLLGWQSPARGPVHPGFVNALERGGIGWLQGFDEMMVRCGLEWNGHPCTDVIPSNTGAPVTMDLTLHGRIANLPAHYVEVELIPGDPPELAVSGVVDEAMLFGSRLRLETRISSKIGSSAFTICDRIINDRDTEAEMQILYHSNFGAPLLGEGAVVSVPAVARGPFNAHAAQDIDTWNVYRAPTPGFVEQCYWHEPLGNADGDTVALVRNAEGVKGVAVRFNTAQLPCFTVWKNTPALSEGYVTGLEPATNFPNPRVFEREHGRVVRLAPGGIHQAAVTIEALANQTAVQAVEGEIETIQGSTEVVVHREPEPTHNPAA